MERRDRRRSQCTGRSIVIKYRIGCRGYNKTETCFDSRIPNYRPDGVECPFPVTRIKKKFTMKNSTTRHIVLLAAGLSALAGCTQSDPEPVETGRDIGFTTSVTRAVKSSLGDGDSFVVWARETLSDGTSTLILTDENVSCENGVWSYDNIRYWKNGARYDFYALYPANVHASLENTTSGNTPQLKITGFNATESADLMTAEKTDFAYEPPAQPVAFTFRHLLAQVQFMGRIDPALDASGVSAHILSVRLYGMPGTGDCTVRPGESDTWTFGEATDVDAPFASGDFGNGDKELTTESISVFENDLLLFPQTVGGGFKLEINYEYTDENNSSNTFTKSVSLADAGLTAWEAGRSYRYTFTVGSEYILFDKPEVVPWNTASGGSITVE